jgi:hypothetical protein
MCLENIENDIFWQSFNTNLNEIVHLLFKILKNKIENFFGEYFRNIPQKKSPKGALVAPISPFALDGFFYIVTSLTNN